MVAWEHRDRVELLVVMVDWVVVRQEKCSKYCCRLCNGCVVSLRVDNGCPSGCIRVV